MFMDEKVGHIMRAHSKHIVRKYRSEQPLGHYKVGEVFTDDGKSWIDPAGSYIDHRSSIANGEFAMLLDSLRNKKITTWLKPLIVEQPWKVLIWEHNNGDDLCELKATAVQKLTNWQIMSIKKAVQATLDYISAPPDKEDDTSMRKLIARAREAVEADELNYE